MQAVGLNHYYVLRWPGVAARKLLNLIAGKQNFTSCFKATKAFNRIFDCPAPDLQPDLPK
ncbi:hypothetical protein DRW42_03565 [Pedobacter miscanthi]|uniref:Uncharacterized protein n=1 Tax=Pedobacter miscanthi TaxID=2259170 RepID=A0A366LEH3_9SPHI|nr:hypothetical protein DRW42_03565 [Pedobacter miscanthi]